MPPASVINKVSITSNINFNQKKAMKKRNLILAALLVAFVSSCETKQQEKAEVNKKDVVVENIMNRRSIRSYKPEQIKDDELKQIIECGINAPSGLNKQSWELRVIQNPDLIAEMNNGFVKYAAGKEMEGSASRSQQPGFSVFHGAPTVIVVASDQSLYSPVDCGLLGENILLSAEAMNIGTCVVGGVIEYLDTPEAKENILPRLNLSEDYKPLYTIVMGYKNESPKAKARDTSKVEYIK